MMFKLSIRMLKKLVMVFCVKQGDLNILKPMICWDFKDLWRMVRERKNIQWVADLWVITLLSPTNRKLKLQFTQTQQKWAETGQRSAMKFGLYIHLKDMKASSCFVSTVQPGDGIMFQRIFSSPHFGPTVHGLNTKDCLSVLVTVSMPL